MTLKDLIEDPEQVDSLTADDLAGIRSELAELAAGIDPDTATADDVAALEAAAALGDRVDARIEALEAERAETLAKVEALRARFASDEVEPVADEPAEEAVAEPELEPVAASAEPAKLPSLSTLKGRLDRKPDPQPDPEPVHALTAAGGTETLATRGSYGERAIRQNQSLGSFRPNRGAQRFPVATLDVDHRYELRGDFHHDAAVIDQVVREQQQLAANGVSVRESALTASGGFCAPAEPIYTQFNIATRAGLISLPTVGAPRGALEYPVSPSLAAFIGQQAEGIGFEWDNDTDTTPGETTKPVYTADCPDTRECEVAAYVTRLQFGNFRARFYPESVEDVTAKALIAHDRAVNEAIIDAIEAFAIPEVVGDPGGGTFVNLAQILGLVGHQYREREGLAIDSVLDAVLPSWVWDNLVADLVARDSTTDFGNARARASALFGSLNLRPQFVYDLSPSVGGANADFPDTAKVLLWAPGTVVRLDAGTLNLGEVRDSTLNATNDYQTFVETFEGVCFPGHRVTSVEVEVCPTGETGNRAAITCEVDADLS
jgi:hypothetical protein